ASTVTPAPRVLCRVVQAGTRCRFLARPRPVPLLDAAQSSQSHTKRREISALRHPRMFHSHVLPRNPTVRELASQTSVSKPRGNSGGAREELGLRRTRGGQAVGHARA